jgi:hypothetical protein
MFTRVSRRSFLNGLLLTAGFAVGRLSIRASRTTAPPSTRGVPELTLTIEAFLAGFLPEGDYPGWRTSNTLPRLVDVAKNNKQAARLLDEARATLDRLAMKEFQQGFRALDARERDTILRHLEGLRIPAYLYLRTQAVQLHFTHPAVQASMGLSHAPQPHGFLDYADAPGA